MSDPVVLDISIDRAGLSEFVDDVDGISDMTVTYVPNIEPGSVVAQIRLTRSEEGAAWDQSLIPGLDDAIDAFMQTESFDIYWDEVYQQLAREEYLADREDAFDL